MSAARKCGEWTDAQARADARAFKRDTERMARREAGWLRRFDPAQRGELRARAVDRAHEPDDVRDLFELAERYLAERGPVLPAVANLRHPRERRHAAAAATKEASDADPPPRDDLPALVDVFRTLDRWQREEDAMKGRAS
jgi:hypothetical protein